MPRLTKHDREMVRLALRIAIDTEESHADAYSPVHRHHIEDPYAAEQIQESSRKIAEFRRLLAIHFGGTEDTL